MRTSRNAVNPPSSEPVDRLAAEVLDHGADRARRGGQREQGEPDVAEVVGASLLALADPGRGRVHGGTGEHPARRHAQPDADLRRAAVGEPELGGAQQDAAGGDAQHRLDGEASGGQPRRPRDRQAHRGADQEARPRRRRLPPSSRPPRGRSALAQLGPEEGDQHHAGTEPTMAASMRAMLSSRNVRATAISTTATPTMNRPPSSGASEALGIGTSVALS